MYRELDDNELLYLVEEDQEYYDVLIEKYQPLIKKICKKYLYLGKKIGYELEDLIQIGNIGLLEAIKYYKEQRHVLFYTYINSCIENKIKNEIRMQTTNKRRMLNNTISYDEIYDGSNQPLIEMLEDKVILNPCDELILKELEEEYILFIQSLPLEVAIAFEMKNDGYTLEQIGKFLRMDIKDISKSLQFAKKRICLN